MASEATTLDYKNDGPQTVYEGRRWTVEIEFYTPVQCTEEEVEQLVEFELGGGSIANDHPLISCDLRRVSAHYARRCDERLYTDWGAKGEDNRRHGRSRTEYGR